MARQAPSRVRSQFPAPPDITAANDRTKAVKQLDLDPSGEAMASGPDVSEEEVRAAAYNRYLARGREDGRADEDWLTAEQELKASRRH